MAASIERGVRRVVARRAWVRPVSAPRRRVLVVDDAEGIRDYLATLLELRGFDVDTASDGRSALALLESGASPDLVLLDVMMPGMDGLETLRRVREAHPRLPVVMLSVVGKASTIVEAMRAGAADYLNKPFEEEELERVLRQAMGEGAGEPEGEDDAALWEGTALAEARELLVQIADTDVTVLLRGESGVGKELVAREVHETSTRREGPFVKVNCAALPGELLESELFGYEKGAFTGAASRKTGKFSQASGGTIFLDEIGEMSATLQAKLLHVLQDGGFTPLGGNREIHADARVVTATHRDLGRMVAEGAFREDLFFRLNVVSVRIPPLRERRSEIPKLVELFRTRAARRYGRPARPLSPQLLALFERHPFPGNVRELENLVKRVVVLGSEEPVIGALLAPGVGESASSQMEDLLDEVAETAGSLPLREVARRVSLEAERSAIERALRETGWNRRRAAALLGVSYKTLLQKIRECGLQRD